MSNHEEDQLQYCKIEYKDFDLYSIYCSPAITVDNIMKRIQTLLYGTKPTYIVGDFNTGSKAKFEQLQSKLQHLHYKMLVTKPTHICGNTLDNIITKDTEYIPYYIHNLYYSDHDALYFDIKK